MASISVLSGMLAYFISSTNDKKIFFTAEFGYVEQDTAKYYSHYSYETDGNWLSKQEKNYWGGPMMGFSALVIKSDKFIQLKRPFKYYTRRFEPLRKPYKVVRKMNKKLNKFYKKANRNS